MTRQQFPGGLLFQLADIAEHVGIWPKNARCRNAVNFELRPPNTRCSVAGQFGRGADGRARDGGSRRRGQGAGTRPPGAAAKPEEPNTKEQKFKDSVKWTQAAVVLVLVY